ncbi:uncharacterized protein BT62DRAFT_935459 [Guyanagaster necrorhizus]|uniref:Uncharacterized protein n=1 Tax=Guyanagaster necrorhizus TaxID=856835 RepID=A0A9P8AQS0_9AGAR|nr:uncharacterized protein BT62DRAFT_935459 [Guyanagaster necrorhizus MCA 3950]KAG7443122.1 hypothetical protein BT62DRAFT_935459 [Guyanagaster necrorhizus MCA 3950]
MGRSAKFAKRMPKKLKSSALATGSSANNTSHAQQVQNAKKRASLKSKAVDRGGTNESLLGGADYVSLMMGGRKKARQEAQKLPKDS